ncbi:LysR family transcriptional regulator [Roseibium sp.]|uniref:LysR family transcriptional regulator n=1 Tax=Roseibium sp. TaxID=1936156 RepID=UPI003B50ED9E
MPTSLPPLSAVRAFDAVSRHLSFTKAGDELGMTQAAVSYQIKLLEEKLGFSLFERKPRKIELTPRGQQLADGVTDAFDRLRGTFHDVQEAESSELVISSNTTFAVTWLSSRLFEFQIQNPTIAVRLVPFGPWETPAFNDGDLTITACYQPPKGCYYHQLIQAEFTPMISPLLAEKLGGIHEPADLLKAPIIDPEDHWWRTWFADAGLPDVDLSQNPSSRMGSQALEANRAIAGQGVAILTPYFVRDALANGQLIQPFKLVSRIESESWNLSYPMQSKNSRKIRLFRDWLFSELEKDGRKLPFGREPETV